MDLTKLQLSELMCKHAAKGNGLHDLMEIMLESMMVAERGEFLADNPGNKGNGYRPGSTYGQGRKLEFRIPRDRYGNFHPQILAILRDQEEECDRLAGVLYPKEESGSHCLLIFVLKPRSAGLKFGSTIPTSLSHSYIIQSMKASWIS